MKVNVNETVYLITLFTQCSVLQFFALPVVAIMICRSAASAYTRHRGAYNRKCTPGSAPSTEGLAFVYWDNELCEGVSQQWTRG